MRKVKRPMKCQDAVMEKLKFPMYASPKIDGIRLLVAHDGKPYTNTLKELHNWYIASEFVKYPYLINYDGELTAGPPNLPDTFHRTQSLTRSHNKVAPFTFHIFDKVDFGTYIQRFKPDPDMLPPWACIVPQVLIHNMKELNATLAKFLDDGYEGMMLRNPNKPYKHGRATVRQNIMLRIKPMADTEGMVVGFEEQLCNRNMPVRQTGRTYKTPKRTPGMRGKQTLGVFLVQVREFGPTVVRVVAGQFTAKQRKEIWLNQGKYLGKMLRFRYQMHGTLKVPRSATAIGFREEFDIGE